MTTFHIRNGATPAARAIKVWSDASSAVYQKWSDESSYLYGLWSAVDSAFCWDDNFDVDAIVAAYDTEQEEAPHLRRKPKRRLKMKAMPPIKLPLPHPRPIQRQMPPTKPPSATISRPPWTATKPSSTNTSPSCKNVNQNPTDLSLLNDYATYMSKYADLAAKFDAWESEDLNTAEALAYYLEVQSRVSRGAAGSLIMHNLGGKLQWIRQPSIT